MLAGGEVDFKVILGAADDSIVHSSHEDDRRFSAPHRS
jgi:hypothetical protein